MKSNRLPGFSAEQTLGRTTRRYRAAGIDGGGQDGGALPQLVHPACGASCGSNDASYESEEYDGDDDEMNGGDR